ncbi:MAG: hypothetical protein OXI90_14255 [Gammaproteobacteria bacterium]|nr:hypothetical protein [Gammaproteobacteria bacterium]
MAAVLHDVALASERSDVVDIVGCAAILQRHDVMPLKLSSTSTSGAPPAVPLEGPQPRKRPPSAVQRRMMAATRMTTTHRATMTIPEPSLESSKVALTGWRGQKLSKSQIAARRKIAAEIGVDFDDYEDGNKSQYDIPLANLGDTVRLTEIRERIRRADEALKDGAPPAEWT